MTDKTIMALDPAALSAFAATLALLPREEISKAKRLYILNAIADFEVQRKTGKAMMITLGVMSIFVWLVLRAKQALHVNCGSCKPKDPLHGELRQRKAFFFLKQAMKSFWDWTSPGSTGGLELSSVQAADPKDAL